MPASDLTSELSVFLKALYAANVTIDANNRPTVLFADGTAAAPSISFSTASTYGFYFVSGSVLGFSGGGTGAVEIGRATSSEITLTSGGIFSWASGAVSAARDTGLARNAAGVVEINNGTAGTLRDLTVRKLTSPNATNGIGYATGAGGTVTQATSKSTGVTLNTVTGLITMNNANLAADTSVSFTLTNSAIAATDQVIVTHDSVGTLGAYGFASGAAAGSATISVHNSTPAGLAEAIVLRFVVFKSVNA